ncbi:hypothetical protein J3998_01905 [Thiomicrorhabdus sp. 6S2-11]|uniref:Glycosyltransferase family 4 protein n=1 Tax=Thiomicrorhabdus marina TaxID=2818442 RepID=A0ABS3Q2H9_9GAMM|nr:hypothetical protein [Thiomicrorhabdus marina]MBO1926318.1 hypothetical protein [Thiomicrorhabdus marina]
MKVLIVSAETWRDDTNGGNVLSNLFSGMDAEFSQIYCNPGKPQNSVCNNYFQMTDQMVLSRVLSRKEIGKSFITSKASTDSKKEIISPDSKENRVVKLLKKFNSESLRVLKDILWLSSNWKNKTLDRFIKETSPDVIFAPCYGSFFMHQLVRHIHKVTNKPVISYISDDFIGYRQFSLSPIFWINRILMRKTVINTSKIYSLLYTMTKEQMDETAPIVHCPMKILKKPVSLTNLSVAKTTSPPIKLIFAGNLYVGRLNVLIELAKAIQILNKDASKFGLHIYSGYQPSEPELAVLNDKQNTFFHGLISSNELQQRYSESDVALHIESFKVKYRLTTRLSFSTKITDCLSSGCAVMVIAWSEHAGFTYLKANNAAICIDSLNKVSETLNDLASCPEKIGFYRQQAKQLAIKNHNRTEIQSMVSNDFQEVITDKAYH